MHIMKCAFHLVCLGAALFKRSQTLLQMEKTMSSLKWCVCVYVCERGYFFALSPWIRLPPMISN